MEMTRHFREFVVLFSAASACGWTVLSFTLLANQVWLSGFSMLAMAVCQWLALAVLWTDKDKEG